MYRLKVGRRMLKFKKRDPTQKDKIIALAKFDAQKQLQKIEYKNRRNRRDRKPEVEPDERLIKRRAKRAAIRESRNIR